MEMTEREIAMNFRLAKYPERQISILAQLNATSEDEILEILRRQGLTELKMRKYPLMSNRCLCQEEQEERMRLYRQGLPDGEVAAELGVSKAGISRWRYKHGLPANEKRSGNNELV